MSVSFPSQFELKCAGCSLILSQALFGIAWLMHTIDYDTYDVENEEQVIELHGILSSDDHRAEVEVACALMWCSFPLLLIAIYGIRKMTMSIMQDTSAEMIVYVAEKAYIIFVSVSTIVLPALSLVTVSYEWSFHEYTGSPLEVPTGYYIQLYALTLELELIDCMSIADATFMVGMFLLPRMILLGSTPSGNPKFKKYRLIMEPQWLQQRHVLSKCCLEVFTSCIVVSLLVMFGIVLFEFARSGFFSVFGYSKFLVAWSLLLKFGLGTRLIFIAYSNKYIELWKVFGNDEEELDTQQIMGGQDQNYHMEPIAPNNTNGTHVEQ